MEKTFVLKGNICYSKSLNSLETLASGYLVCENGYSAGVFPCLPEKYAALPLFDYGDSMIIPGLVDLHTHAPQYSFRALGMDLELLEWLNTHTFPEETKYENLVYAEKAYARFVDDVKRGPNTRACIFATVHPAATMLLMDMLEASGLVTMVGKVNMDRNSSPDLQETGAEESLRATKAWIEACYSYRNTTPILTPRFVPSCSDGLLRGLGQLRQEYNLPVQSHLCENKEEIAWVKELCPDAASYADAYARFGLFGTNARTVMAHCVWLSEEESELIRENGVYIAHCPQSNTNLASGIAPVRRFLENGMRVGLGSDVAGGAHTSIFRAMSDAIQVSKLYWRFADPESKPLTVREAFYLATLGGGSFFGKVGSFGAGYEVDAVVIDDTKLSAPSPLSLEDRLAQIVYLSDDRNIRAKYVQGAEVVL